MQCRFKDVFFVFLVFAQRTLHGLQGDSTGSGLESLHQLRVSNPFCLTSQLQTGRASTSVHIRPCCPPCQPPRTLFAVTFLRISGTTGPPSQGQLLLSHGSRDIINHFCRSTSCRNCFLNPLHSVGRETRQARNCTNIVFNLRWP